MGIIIIPGQDQGPEPTFEDGLIDPEVLDRLVRRAIEANRRTPRTTLSQTVLDNAVEALHAEGEVHLAAGLLQLMAARIAGIEPEAVAILIDGMAQLAQLGALDRACRVCGCTELFGCEGGCEWVEFDLCSVCDSKLKTAIARTMGPGPGRDGP
jgi:hypothetical protein